LLSCLNFRSLRRTGRASGGAPGGLSARHGARPRTPPERGVRAKQALASSPSEQGRDAQTPLCARTRVFQTASLRLRRYFLVRFPRLAAEAAALVAGPAVATYIRFQQDALIASALPIPDRLQERLSGYIREDVLRQTRLIQTDPLPIDKLPFPHFLRWAGISLPTAALTDGIALGSLIAVRHSLTESLLFHELVHVVQYRLLGVGRFARLYVRGFLATGRYEDIPLERCAFELERRFVMDRRAFCVESEVAGWVAQGRL
jgi:hypothetical protein